MYISKDAKDKKEYRLDGILHLLVLNLLKFHIMWRIKNDDEDIWLEIQFYRCQTR